MPTSTVNLYCPNQSPKANLSAEILFVSRLEKLVSNSQRHQLSPVCQEVGPLCSQRPHYLCSLFIINSFLSAIPCTWKFLCNQHSDCHNKEECSGPSARKRRRQNKNSSPPDFKAWLFAVNGKLTPLVSSSIGQWHRGTVLMVSRWRWWKWGFLHGSSASWCSVSLYRPRGGQWRTSGCHFFILNGTITKVMGVKHSKDSMTQFW